MFQKRIFLVLIILVLSLQSINVAQTNISDKFLFRSQTYQSKTLPYRLFVPDNYNPSNKYPLMLCLHGSGERGSDNVRQITANHLATAWADSIYQLQNPCFVVAPQCPTEENWNNFFVEHSLVTSNMLTVINILDSLEKEFDVDPNRIYITGLSMGGFGTWDAIMRFPDKFAAAIPMSSGGDYTNLSLVEHVPIWDFHGRMDPDVPVEYSRIMIEGLEQIGRQTVYTHCSNSDCLGLPDSIISTLINNGADLLYTEYETGGHVIWDQAYATPQLHDWVFKQHKIPNGIVINNFGYHKVVSGMQEINWNSELSGGHVDLSYSADDGKNWNKLIVSYSNAGSFLWNSEQSKDSYFGLLKIIYRDSNNFLSAEYTSVYFTVNNSGNGKPFIKILNQELNFGGVINSSQYQLTMLIGDPDTDSLQVDLYYSPDSGKTKTKFDSFKAPSDTVAYTKNLDLKPFQNSTSAVLYAKVSDGRLSYNDSVYYFQKINDRDPLQLNYIQPISKFYEVPLTINIIDSIAAAGSDYLLTFDDTSSTTQKYFSVFDMKGNQFIISHSEFYPNNESRIFNGLSLITDDVYTKSNLTRSGWNQSVSKQLSYSAAPFFLNNNYPTYNGYAKPNDYKIVFYGTIVDTSIADTLYPITPSNIITAKPIDFKVFNISDDEKLNVSFLKTGTISKTYSIWWKENIGGNVKRTWRINITDNEPTRIIPFGDTLYFYTYKGLSIYDSLRISFQPTLVEHSEDGINLTQYKLFQNYPNPFNPSTKIRWQSPVSNWQELKLYDILGNEVATLVDEYKPAGSYEVDCNASKLSSGVYFYQLKAGNFIDTKKMLLLK